MSVTQCKIGDPLPTGVAIVRSVTKPDGKFGNPIARLATQL